MQATSLTDKRRADARSARVLEDDQRRQPRDRPVIVNRWEEVRCNQPDDFAVSVRCDESRRGWETAERAEALGATLAAWGAVAIALSFDSDSIEEAVGLASAIGEETAEGETPWQCGVAEGEMVGLVLDSERLWPLRDAG